MKRTGRVKSSVKYRAAITFKMRPDASLMSRFQADCIAGAVKMIPEEAEVVAVASVIVQSSGCVSGSESRPLFAG